MNQTTIDSAAVTAGRLGDQALLFLPSLLTGLVILVAGLFLASRLSRAAGAALARSARIDRTIQAPIVAIVKYLIVIMALVIALGQVGVQMTSLLAVLGAAGLAIGLALQGTLTNIAAGIMLLWLRPFRVGDYVETAAFAGTVREIGLFVSHLETFDGLFVFAPNSTLWNVWLRNHSRGGVRTLAWTVTVPRSVPADAAQALLVGVWVTGAGETPPLQGAEAHLDALTADDQVLVLRGEVAEGAIGDVQRRTPERILEAFRERFGPDGAPKAVARLVPGDADPSRFLHRDEAPEAHGALVIRRPEAPKQGTTANPPEAAETAPAPAAATAPATRTDGGGSPSSARD